ncbi:MAG: hypothetical protein QOJ06_2004 [Pseudonocardiales bacterium]|nr:hypothetical protein [Pseudonocardiales bacterium]
MAPRLTGLRWNGDGDPITAAIRGGELVRQPVSTTEVPSWAQKTGTADIFRDGLSQVVVAPVIVDGLVVAVVSFLMHHTRPPWNEDDLHALGQIARYAGIALEHGLTYQATRESALVL